MSETTYIGIGDGERREDNEGRPSSAVVGGLLAFIVVVGLWSVTGSKPSVTQPKQQPVTMQQMVPQQQMIPQTPQQQMIAEYVRQAMVQQGVMLPQQVIVPQQQQQQQQLAKVPESRGFIDTLHDSKKVATWAFLITAGAGVFNVIVCQLRRGAGYDLDTAFWTADLFCMILYLFCIINPTNATSGGNGPQGWIWVGVATCAAGSVFRAVKETLLEQGKGSGRSNLPTLLITIGGCIVIVCNIAVQLNGN